MSALDIIKPSVDPKIMDEYYAMASEMMKRKTNNDNIPFWTVI